MKNKFSNGSITMLVLCFGAAFVFIFSGLTGLISVQHRQSRQKAALSQALSIAESGANYSRWRLAHAPSDYDFSGVYDYKDPEGGVIGHYALEVIPPAECSTAVAIRSTGWTDEYPNLKRTVSVRFGRPSLAQYSFLTNTDVWFGEDEELKGPFHSNGGIRMDGAQNALSSSAKENYTCQPMHGCSPTQTKPGIWGAGGGGAEGLWQFPVPAIDFNAITLDMAQLKAKAQDGGYYFGSSGAFGYHVKFKNDSTFDLYKVTKLKPNVTGYDTDGNKIVESNDIDKETFLQNYPLSVGVCNAQNLIFVEDGKVWVDGSVKEKATVVAARFPDNPATNASIIINGSITRADPKATLVALIAQKNILVPYYSPNVLEIQAVMIAQKGAAQRYYYAGDVKNKIHVRGAVITNKVWTWSWVNSKGAVISGYKNTEAYYEPTLIYNPPPFFPSAGEHRFISWEEIQ